MQDFAASFGLALDLLVSGDSELAAIVVLSLRVTTAIANLFGAHG